ncbi:maf-like protein DDB_G0281937 isoform X6 [Citrus clementina]|uniref:maf-like protein DDB_G0281937 isoform X6 n=1 Tax=Citrus clementina TaxID=85681 RepID=UPI000CED20AB|nr:maf-like protein DDB_G0281937 isoform X6 [Citrus x clementina]
MNKKEASGIARVNDKITPFLNSPVSPSEFRQSLGNMEASATPVKIILGSSSMPRRKILAEMGYEFSVMAADIDEKSIRKEKPEDLVMAIAEAKADAIISKLQITDSQLGNVEQTILIVADTVVVYEGVIREKPSSREEARRFIKDPSSLLHDPTQWICRIDSVIWSDTSSSMRYQMK